MATEARTIAQVLPSLSVVEAPVNRELVSSDALLKLDLAKIPERLTDPMLAKLEAIANCHLPPPASCPVDSFNATMAGLQACLPSQSRSDVSLEAQAEAYGRMLGGYSAEAIQHLEVTALARLKWFPTIAECIEILKEFPTRNPLAEKRSAVLRRISAEHTTRFDEAMARLATEEPQQDWIDALPETWKQMAETRSLLRVDEEGRYTLRHSSARELAAARLRRVPQ